MKNKGFSLVEIMVILGALGGIALLVTKLGKNTMNIKNETMISNDYNDMVREAHFLLANSKSCKVSLAGTTFRTSEATTPLKNLEFWTSDSKGQKRVKKKLAKDEKFASIQIEDVTLQLDPITSTDGGKIQNTTGLVKISLVKSKNKTPLADIEHSINLNISTNKEDGKSTIVDCEEDFSAQEKTKVWCGIVQNPCGSETFQAVAVGRYEDGKFTGILQPTTVVEGKICSGAVNFTATLTPCGMNP
ncbi:MAG: hypothetical protein WC635_11460 [Bacteriovorax sp.]|jgi:hypothetical protein